MCARSGDLDPSIVTFLMKKENLSSDEMDRILNKESGAYGISGVSPDIRDIEAAALDGNKRAKLALKQYELNIAQYIAKHAVAMGGIDVLVFMGVELDNAKNEVRSEEAEISSQNSSVKVYVIPTNEELVIARDTLNLVK